MGIGQFTDQSAPPAGVQERIDSLEREVKTLSAKNIRLDKALALAIVNKDAAENQERLRRAEIDRLLLLCADAKRRFDDIASDQQRLTPQD